MGPARLLLKLREHINDDSDYPNVVVHVALENRLVFCDQLLNDGKEGATILLITCRLGCESVSEPMASSISQWMQDKYCGGMLCGVNGRGLYAFTCDGLHLHCLDPHVLRLELQSIDHDFVISDEYLHQIHTDDYCTELAMQDMDPEMVISFVFPDRQILRQWLDKVLKETPGDDDMFSVLETAPKYSIGTNGDDGDVNGWSVL